jgi:dTMP kinase
MFITFEGLDGSGKTTQVKELAAHLRGMGNRVLLTREPGGTEIGDRIRDILQDRANMNLTSQAELLLFCASRAQIIAEVIRPHLQSGGIVICDRFADSTIAYQGYGRGIDIGFLHSILNFVTDGLHPDLTLYLDITPEEGVARRLQASLFGEEFSRIDQMELDFHRRVRQGYLDLMAAEPARWVRIDAAQSAAAVQASILEVLDARLALAVG